LFSFKDYYIKNREKIKEYDEQYREKYADKIKQRKQKYYIKNRENILQKTKQYKIEHKEETERHISIWQKNNYKKCLGYMRKYQKTEKSLEYQKQYRENNREKVLEGQRRWRINNPKKAKAIGIKAANKRRRNLGFNPLNKYFGGSEAHHINKDDVIYILKELHRSIPHCLESGKNMDKINKIAMSYV